METLALNQRVSVGTMSTVRLRSPTFITADSVTNRWQTSAMVASLLPLTSKAWTDVEVSDVSTVVSQSSLTRSVSSIFDSLKGLLTSPTRTVTVPLLVPSGETGFVGMDTANLSHVHVYSSGMISEPLSFSFAADGVGCIYQLGVASAIQQMIHRNVLDQSVFIGSETGGLIARVLAVGQDIEAVYESLVSQYELEMCSR